MLNMDLNVSEPESIIIKDESTAFETFTLIIPCYLLTIFVINLISFHNLSNQLILRCFIEILILAVPNVYIITILSLFTIEIIILLLIACLTLAFATRTSSYKINCFHETKQVTFITNVRAMTNLLTAVAILAVDFEIFPRSFMKNEQYGYSLMDLGVGLFIYANGLVAPELRYKTPPMLNVLKSCIPLFILGLARFLVLKEIDYKVSVAEYGVHWNFFLTLAVTKIVCSAIFKFIPINLSFMAAVILIVIHESLLHFGLADYVFNDIERNNFLSSNREGIVSCLGYVSLYFLSVTFGQIFSNKGALKNKLFVLKLLLFSSILLILSIISNSYFGTSRRLANMAYCLWISFIGLFLTCLFLIAEMCLGYTYEKRTIKNKVYVPLLFEAINYNSLVYFLISNLITGFVNIVFDTKKVTAFYSIGILTIYVCVTSLIIIVLYVKRIKLKV